MHVCLCVLCHVFLCVHLFTNKPCQQKHMFQMLWTVFVCFQPTMSKTTCVFTCFHMLQPPKSKTTHGVICLHLFQPTITKNTTYVWYVSYVFICLPTNHGNNKICFIWFGMCSYAFNQPCRTQYMFTYFHMILFFPIKHVKNNMCVHMLRTNNDKTTYVFLFSYVFQPTNPDTKCFHMCSDVQKCYDVSKPTFFNNNICVHMCSYVYMCCPNNIDNNHTCCYYYCYCG